MALLSMLGMSGKRVRNDVVGIELDAATARVVRVRHLGGAATLVAADILPRPAPPAAADQRQEPLVLPHALQGMHAAIALTAPEVSVRLLSAPGGAGKVEQLAFSELLGLPEGADYRIGYEALPADGRGEQQVLAVGIPEALACRIPALFPRGLPAPASLQAGGAAALNCIARELADHHGDPCALAIQVGGDVTHLSGFYKGRLVLFRLCPFGHQAVLRSVQERLGIDEELVPGMLDDGLVDASESIGVVIEPFLKQLILAREFVERRRMCRIERIFLCGALLGAPHWKARIEATMGIEPTLWNPLATLAAAEGAQTVRVKGMEGRFAAAMGAALALLETGRDLPR